MPLWWPFPVGLAFVAAALLTSVIGFVATRIGIVDVPKGERKIHDHPVPLLGGLAIYLAFAVSTLVVLATSTSLTSGEMGAEHLAGFLVGGFILMIGGYLDDRYDLSPRYSLLFPLAASFAAVAFGIGVEKMTNPLGGFVLLPSIVSTLFTFVWLLVMTYTTKLLDGIDGLDGSVALLGGAMIAALALTEKYYQPDVVILALLFIAALAGFLVWNFYPARIFLGEGGSTFLGFALGVLAVIAGSKVATVLLVLGMPALDLTVVMGRRLIEGRSIASGDRYHLHHLLLDNGLTQRQVVFVYMALCALFGVTSLLFSSLEKVLALLALAGLVILLIIFLQGRKRKL